MCRLDKNKGSATIEMTIIMPIIILIIFFLIELIIATVEEAASRYCIEAYIYEQVNEKDSTFEISDIEENISGINMFGKSELKELKDGQDQISFKIYNVSGINLLWKIKDLTLVHEYNIRKNNVSENLRRWQMIE